MNNQQCLIFLECDCKWGYGPLLGKSQWVLSLSRLSQLSATWGNKQRGRHRQWDPFCGPVWRQKTEDPSEYHRDVDNICPTKGLTHTHTLLRFLVDEESRTSGRLMPKCPSGQGMSIMVEHHVNWTWIPNQPILDSPSNCSKHSNSKWSRYMAERPQTTSLPGTQLRWIRSVTGSLIPVL